MKTLVVFYSRDGAARKAGEAIAKNLNCDMEEIFDAKNRAGALGYILAGRDAMRKKLTTIKETAKDPAAYDLVILGTPVWGSTVTPAIRTYLTQNKGKLKNVAFYCTEGGSGGPNAFREMEEICGKKPVATLELRTAEAMQGDSDKIRKFMDEMISAPYRK